MQVIYAIGGQHPTWKLRSYLCRSSSRRGAVGGGGGGGGADFGRQWPWENEEMEGGGCAKLSGE